MFAAWIALVACVGVAIGSWYGPRIALGQKAWGDLALAALSYMAAVAASTHIVLTLERRLRGR